MLHRWSCTPRTSKRANQQPKTEWLCGWVVAVNQTINTSTRLVRKKTQQQYAQHKCVNESALTHSRDNSVRTYSERGVVFRLAWIILAHMIAMWSFVYTNFPLSLYLIQYGILLLFLFLSPPSFSFIFRLHLMILIFLLFSPHADSCVCVCMCVFIECWFIRSGAHV